MDRKELEHAKTENAHLTAHVAVMTQELSQKNDEIRNYHAEHAVVFNRIRTLVGHPGEIINKAHHYDRMMESGDPASARQTIFILVKYSRVMKDLLAKNPEGGSAERNTPASTLSGSAQIANQNPLRGGG